MKRHLNLRGKWWARCLAHLIPIIALLSLLPVSPVQAGGMAISGTFSGQHFRLILGENLCTPDIYVVVFNNTDSDMQVKLVSQTPPGVELTLSESEDFQLSSGSQQRIEVGVAVGHEAAPGEYTLTLTAEACAAGEGIKLAAAAQQQAKLTIFGEAASLVISAVTPEGDQFPATLKLFREAEGQSLPCGHSNTGRLETRLVPGDYLAEAYFQDNVVADESFSLAADENKDVTLVARTVFLEGFSVVPHYHNKTGELAFVKMVYTIKNLYQPLKDVKAALKVSLDGQAAGEVELISLPTLDVGRTAGSSNYIPTEGWQDGIYSFKIELYNHGKLYTQSSAQEMATELAEEEASTAKGAGTTINWPLISCSVVGVVIASAAVLTRKKWRTWLTK